MVEPSGRGLGVIGIGCLLGAELSYLRNMVHTLVWFLLLGAVVYAVSLTRRGRPGAGRFSYPHPIAEPGEQFSLRGAFDYLLPASFYKHRSFRCDMLYLPFSIMVGFFGLAGVTLGPGLVQSWLLHRLGPSPLHLPDNGFTVALQVVLVLLARDFGRFMWHYQGHVVPFFWEFHKGHHSAEVLHPFGVRTHPVDMYAPYMHHFHHGALPQHMNVNLGITGGLTLWDYLFGTLYWPTLGEKIVWGASLAELGEKNPHRTLKGFFYDPFVAAFASLRRGRPVAGVTQPASISNTIA